MKRHPKSNRALIIFAVALFVLLAATASMAQRRRAVVVRPVRHPIAARHALVVRAGPQHDLRGSNRWMGLPCTHDQGVTRGNGMTNWRTTTAAGVGPLKRSLPVTRKSAMRR